MPHRVRGRVAASSTTVTDVMGVGPVMAADPHRLQRRRSTVAVGVMLRAVTRWELRSQLRRLRSVVEAANAPR